MMIAPIFEEPAQTGAKSEERVRTDPYARVRETFRRTDVSISDYGQCPVISRDIYLMSRGMPGTSSGERGICGSDARQPHKSPCKPRPKEALQHLLLSAAGRYLL